MTCPELQRLRDELAATLQKDTYWRRTLNVNAQAAIERHIRKCKTCKGKR